MGRQLREIVDQMKGLKQSDEVFVLELIEVGEELVVFEIFCTQAYEWGVELPKNTLRELADMGHWLGAKPDYVEWLWDCADRSADERQGS